MRKGMKELGAVLLVICMAFVGLGMTGYAAENNGVNVLDGAPPQNEGGQKGGESGLQPQNGDGETNPNGLEGGFQEGGPEEGGPQGQALDAGTTYYVVYNYNYPDGTGGTSGKIELGDTGTFTIGTGSTRQPAEGYVFDKWYAGEDTSYSEGTEIGIDELKKLGKEDDNKDMVITLTAGWCQEIKVTVDGVLLTEKQYKAGDSISKPEKEQEGYDLVKWTLNEENFEKESITPGFSVKNYIKDLDNTNEYGITYSNPKANFVSYWKPDPSSGYLIKIENSTGIDLTIGNTEISAGSTTRDPVGIYTTLDEQYSTDHTYKIQMGNLNLDNAKPEDVIYDGINVSCYTVKIKAGDLQRCVELLYQSSDSNVTFEGAFLSNNNSIELVNGQSSIAVVDNTTSIEDLKTASSVTASRPGYTFRGWKYQTGNGASLNGTDKLPSGCAKIICTPVWGGEITFDANYPEADAAIQSPGKETENTGNSLRLKKLTDSSGKYRFLGWAASEEAEVPDYTDTYTVEGNAALYGVWTEQEYSLVWKDREADAYSPSIEGNYTVQTYGTEKVSYGDKVGLPEDPVKPGYVFLGWDAENGGQGIEGCPLGYYSQNDPLPEGARMPARDAVITAGWTPVKYKIVYDGNGAGMGVPSSPVENLYYGGRIELPALSPSRVGYTFAGWEYGGVLYPAGSTFEIPAADYNENLTATLVLTASWTRNRHQVNYDGGGAVSGVPGSQEADYNATVTAGAGPVRDGYVFTGWEQISTGKVIGAGATFIMPDMDETLRAMWKIAYSRIGGPGTYYLISGQQYGLDFRAKVQGDAGQYESGITFYVRTSGYYTFTE